MPLQNEALWLFFDVGSTLVDESRAYEHRIRTMLSGTDIPSDEFYQAMLGFYRQNRKGDLEAARHWGLNIPAWNSEEEVLYPETHPLVERLSRRFSLGIIANQPRGTEERLRRFGILDFFSVVVSSAEEGISKPDPRMFERALERAHCPPERAVMIGDRIDNDIVPAKALGMQTIWVRQGFSAYAIDPPHQDKADAVIDNVGQVEGVLTEWAW